MQRKFLVKIQYNGKNYSGWQKNPNSDSIQEEVENALEKLFEKKVDVVGVSRTDAGVSAYEYPLCFSVDTKLPTDRIPFKLNRFLPKDIQVFESKEVDLSFNLRKTVVSKIYTYSIYVSPVLLPLFNRDAYWIKPPFDEGELKKALSYLIGKHDLTAFTTLGGDNYNPHKTIKNAELIKEGVVYKIRLEADGFPYNAVRIIAGTLVRIACEGKAEDILSIINGKDRQNAGMTLPAKGLALTKVEIEF